LNCELSQSEPNGYTVIILRFISSNAFISFFKTTNAQEQNLKRRSCFSCEVQEPL